MAEHPTNRLAEETSPYLLQHARNPVDWHPWGPGAFEKAKRENKPIFLSVGYSACHWCHVMERECFEVEEIARLMNEGFVNVKVDREERPDVDQIYMTAVQAMTGHGGWPMSVFLTPELKPFYGGTYFPPADRQGMPGFPRVLSELRRAWEERRDEVERVANGLTERLRGLGEVPERGGPDKLGTHLIDRAGKTLIEAFDPVHGGFGAAPKFPHAMDLRLSLRRHARFGDPKSLEVATLTLDKMARGGIHDQLAGGFARYSTDDKWLVPHFEKMLYDNALLATTYLEAFQATGRQEYAEVTAATLDYLLERMTSPEGGFYSAEDADSEGVEGKYYVWTLAEIREILGEARSRTFAAVYDVSERGNFEGANILNLPVPIEEAAVNLGRDPNELRRDLAEDRGRLLQVRETRIPPQKDTKVLASWNGLAIAAFAQAGAVFGFERYSTAARRAADFALDRMRQDDGKLFHAYKDGRARFNGMLDDYADLIDGLVLLFEADGRARWIEAALELSKILVDEFFDAESGGFYFTGRNHESLIARQKDVFDNATPSGNAMAATALSRLAATTGRDDLKEIARACLGHVYAVMERAPMAAGQSLIALDFMLQPARECVVVAGSDPEEFQKALRTVRRPFRPETVFAPVPEPASRELERLVPLLADRPAIGGETTVYLCESFACREPIVGLERIVDAFSKAGSASP